MAVHLFLSDIPVPPSGLLKLASENTWWEGARRRGLGVGSRLIPQLNSLLLPPDPQLRAWPCPVPSVSQNLARHLSDPNRVPSHGGIQATPLSSAGSGNVGGGGGGGGASES